jgi:hypothetical protein
MPMKYYIGPLIFMPMKYYIGPLIAMILVIVLIIYIIKDILSNNKRQ